MKTGGKKKKKKGVAVDEDLFTGDVGVSSRSRSRLTLVGLVKEGHELEAGDSMKLGLEHAQALYNVDI